MPACRKAPWQFLLIICVNVSKVSDKLALERLRSFEHTSCVSVLNLLQSPNLKGQSKPPGLLYDDITIRLQFKYKSTFLYLLLFCVKCKESHLKKGTVKYY